MYAAHAERSGKMSFYRLCILVGLLLILVTIYAVSTSQTSFVTAFLPALAGAILIALGFLAANNPNVRNQVVITATALAGLAFLGSLRLLFIFNDPGQSQASLLAHLATLILSAVLGVMGFRLFLTMHRST